MCMQNSDRHCLDSLQAYLKLLCSYFGHNRMKELLVHVSCSLKNWPNTAELGVKWDTTI